MKVRSIEKALADYEALRKRYGNQSTDFYISDCQQIRSMAKQAGGEDYTLIHTALMAGFAIGYRTAVRHERQKNK